MKPRKLEQPPQGELNFTPQGSATQPGLAPGSAWHQWKPKHPQMAKALVTMQERP